MTAPPPRLNSPPPKGHNRPPKPPRYTRTCPECGEPFRTDVAAQEFCCQGHKRDFNNRRQKRGAELYDLIMAWRFNRDEAKGLKVMTMLSRMASDFRAEDQEQRAGRPSWRKPKTVLSRHPHLYAVVTNVRRK